MENLHVYLHSFGLTFTLLLRTSKKKPFENTVRKGENADKQHFLFLSQCFYYPIKEKSKHFSIFSFVVCKWLKFGQAKNFVVLDLIGSKLKERKNCPHTLYTS